MPAKIYDTLVREYLQNPGAKGLGLDDLANKMFSYEKIHYDDITNKSKISFSEVPIDTVALYSAEDVYMTYEIYKKQSSYIDLELEKVFLDIDMPLVEVLKDMELAGVKIDTKKLKEIGEFLRKEIIILEKTIFESVGEEFNLSSPKQLGVILFEKMGLATAKKTKTGYSVDAEVLEELAVEHHIVAKILEHRKYNKLLSTYVEGFLDLVDEKGIIHTSYNQTVTTTGRLSSTSPNLQNIPVGEDDNFAIRKVFIPVGENDLILTADYSQVELRLLAIMSGDKELIGAFKRGVDIHTKTANFMFGSDQISSGQRKMAKVVNFGVIYGMSAFGLSKILNISVKEAKNYIDRFFLEYSGVSTYFDKVVRDCKEKGYVSSMFGRKRFIAGINDSNAMIRQGAEREAINMPIQATAADVIKIAMIRLHNFIHENNLQSRMIMQVHDELVFNIVSGELDIMREGVKTIMEGVIDNEVKLFVDIGVANSWGESKK